MHWELSGYNAVDLCHSHQWICAGNFQNKKWSFLNNRSLKLRCNVQIPRSLETSELPWCEELKINLSDPHQLLKHRHHGRNVEVFNWCNLCPTCNCQMFQATIGTPAYLHNDGELQWQLLDVEEVQWIWSVYALNNHRKFPKIILSCQINLFP